MHIQIRNKKNYKGSGFYVGRPTPLGNPFKISDTLTREESIKKYRDWLRRKVIEDNQNIVRSLDELFSFLVNNQNITLICWCSPEYCHAEVIRDFLLNKYYCNEYISEKMKACLSGRKL